jgi:hypothetical protein
MAKIYLPVQHKLTVVRPKTRQAYSKLLGRQVMVGEVIELDSKPKVNQNQYGRSGQTIGA